MTIERIKAIYRFHKLVLVFDREDSSNASTERPKIIYSVYCYLTCSEFYQTVIVMRTVNR